MSPSALGLSTQPQKPDVASPPPLTPPVATTLISNAAPFAKNIIVFCDGTGQDGLITSLTKEEIEDTQKQLEKKPESQGKPIHPVTYPTNVLRLSRCIPLFTDNEPRSLQVVYYQSGVGVGDDFRGHADLGDDYEKARGTATGSKIRDAYNFIAQNYTDGDKIFLFGFSRGAYTARKVAGLICKLGLLDRRQMGRFFHYWSALDRNDQNVEITVGRPASIDFLGVWDTVGSVFEDLSPKVDALTLADTDLPEGVKVARHALSFHENRKEFLPTPFAGFDSSRDVKQVWFPGAHSDVGGSYKERLIADITLCWMAGEAVSAGLTLDQNFLQDCFTKTREASPELRLHFERRPGLISSLLTVDRMNVLVKTPTSKEVTLSNVESRFLYHQSLWAEVRESPKGESWKAFPSKKGPDPEKAPLTEFEKTYWDSCYWNRLLRPLRVPMARGSSPATPPSTLSPRPGQRVVEFEMVSDYTNDMFESGVF